MLKQVLADEAVGKTALQVVSRFKTYQTSVNDDPHLGGQKTSVTDKDFDKMYEVSQADHCQNIRHCKYHNFDRKFYDVQSASKIHSLQTEDSIGCRSSELENVTEKDADFWKIIVGHEM